MPYHSTVLERAIWLTFSLYEAKSSVPEAIALVAHRTRIAMSSRSPALSQRPQAKAWGTISKSK